MARQQQFQAGGAPYKQCPVCGGAIHPIAGRCKHCKTDLVKLAEHTSRADRASRMAAPAAMPEGHVTVPQAAPTAPTQVAGSAPAPAPTSIPPAPTLATAPAPGSAWARRWPYAVGGIALIAIGISVGILVKQPADDGAPNRTESGRSPHMIPDHMQQPSPPIGQAPSFPGPHGSLPPGMPGMPGAPSSPPSSTGAAPSAGTFTVALTNAVCAKLTDCGQMDDFSVLLCHELAAQLEDPDAEARVRRGECRYDAAAAATCLDTIGNLDCSAQTTDVMSLMGQTSSLLECTSVYVCM